MASADLIIALVDTERISLSTYSAFIMLHQGEGENHEVGVTPVSGGEKLITAGGAYGIKVGTFLTGAFMPATSSIVFSCRRGNGAPYDAAEEGAAVFLAS